MDNFQLDLFKAAIGTHTTDKTKREFMLKLYDIYLSNITYLNVKNYDNKICKILLNATVKYSEVEMPEYYKATICILKQL